MKLTKATKFILGLLVLVMSFSLFSACSSKTTAKDNVKYYLASLPNDGGKISKGTQMVVDEMNKALAPFNATVTYVACDDYSVVAESILSGTAHFATPSGATFTKAHLEDNNVIPMFTRGPNGDVTKGGYVAYIGTHMDNKSQFEGLSKQEALSKLKNKSFSFVSATSTSGRLVPTTTFWKAFGPKGSKEISSRSQIFEQTTKDGGIFSEVQFGGNHPGSVNLIREKKVFAGAFCEGFWEDYQDEIYIITKDLVPPGPFWTNSANVPKEHIEALVKHFTSLDDSNAPEGFFNDEDGALKAGWRYAAVDHTFYDFLKEMYAGE